MAESRKSFAVFSKPWKEMSVAELGEHLRTLGFDGVEFPVRPGYQVEPENVSDGLPKLATELAEYGVRIESVAGPTDEKTMAACAEAGVPIIRICVSIGDEGYMATEAKLQKEYDALVPILDKHGVKLGIQNHCGRCVTDAMGVRHLIEKYDPKHFGVVWDAGHSGLCGEEPELGLDIAWSHLCMVNLKNALWRRSTGPEAENVEWRSYWTTGRHGLASWPRAVAELKRRNYDGPICLTAEYSDHDSVDRLIAEDIAFVKELFARDE